MWSSVKQKAFTLVEMVVVLAIGAILIAVVIFNYKDADSALIMRNLAYEVSLTVRQAQTYGLGVKESSEENDAFDHAYGVQFTHPTANVFNDTFYLFSDIYNDTSDKEYRCNQSDSSGACTSAGGDEVIDALSLTRQITFQSMCGHLLSDGSSVCTNSGSNNVVNISFKRPNPDAVITLGTSTRLADVTLRLVGQNGSTVDVYVNTAGQISVQN